MIDAAHMKIIHRGDMWPHDTPPSSKTMAIHLEKNESIISWLQPVDGGVLEQIPCIQSHDILFPLSLRMQKAVWRHVRLKKDYVNIEPMSQGGFKLKIPHLLLKEKVRTQARFNVSYAHDIVTVVVTPKMLLTPPRGSEHAIGQDSFSV